MNLYKSDMKLFGAHAENKAWKTSNALNLDQAKVTQNLMKNWLMAT